VITQAQWDRWTTAAICALGTVGVVGILAEAACTKKVVVLPLVVVPLTTWTIPLSLDDDVQLCVATELGAGVNPEDVRPLRCVSVGAVRAWIRAQRMAE